MKSNILNSIAISIITIGTVLNSCDNRSQNKEIRDLYENDLMFAKQDSTLLDIDSLVAERLEELFNHINKGL